MLAAFAPYASESDSDDDDSYNNNSVNDDGAFDKDNSKKNPMNVEFDSGV